MHFAGFDVWVVYMGISLLKKKKKNPKQNLANIVCRNMQTVCMFAKGVCSLWL